MCLILEGPQGLKKARRFRLLATVGDRAGSTIRTCTSPPETSYVSLRGSWIVELAEAQQLIRARDRRCKSFFTKLCRSIPTTL